MSYSININPIEIKDTCEKVELYVPYVLNATDINVIVYYKIAGETKKIEQVYINPEEYSLWTADDDYLKNLVLSKLNLTENI